jgi:hypothetical protein
MGEETKSGGCGCVIVILLTIGLGTSCLFLGGLKLFKMLWEWL